MKRGDVNLSKSKKNLYNKKWTKQNSLFFLCGLYVENDLPFILAAVQLIELF